MTAISRTITGVALTAMLLTGMKASAGPKFQIEKDSWVSLSFLGQFHYSYTEDAAQEQDFYLRRARIILSGQLMDGVTFFAETDNDNAGKNGLTTYTDIQDAFVDLRLVDTEKSQLWIAGGLILLPFSFENKSSAASLLGIDYNIEAMKLVNTFTWRDYGAELHGNFGKRFSYRIGMFDGYDQEVDTKSDKAGLRFTGHFALNLVGDAEAGSFYSQNRLSKSSYFSVGAGMDRQDKATRLMSAATEENPSAEIGQRDSTAWVVDMQSCTTIREYASLTLNAAYFNWDSATFDGKTAFVESGLLVDQTMLTLKLSHQAPDADNVYSTRDYTLGLHYFMKGNNARGGLEYRWGDSANQALLGLQILL